MVMVYIISQIITVGYFAILTKSYLMKDRMKILIANFIAHIGQGISMLMLAGETGVAMSFIMAVRDVIYIVQELQVAKGKSVGKKFDFIVLIITILLIVLLTIPAYDGKLSLLSVIATLITTLSLWQKDVKVYKLLGIIASTLWLFYNAFIFSIMGVILEIVLLVASIKGYIDDVKLEKIKKGI